VTGLFGILGGYMGLREYGKKRGEERETSVVLGRDVKAERKAIVFPDGNEERVLRAVQVLNEERICAPVLIGDEVEVRARAQRLGVTLGDVAIVNHLTSDRRAHYRKELVKLRARKGVAESDADRLLARRGYFGAMMVRMGDADGMLSGLTKSYPEAIRPFFEVVGLAEGHARAAGVYVVIQKDDVLFFADAAVNIHPTAEELAEIAGLGARTAEWFPSAPRLDRFAHGGRALRGAGRVAGGGLRGHGALRRRSAGHARRDDEELLDMTRQTGAAILALSEKAGIEVQGGTIRIIGKEPVAFFSHKGKTSLPPGSVFTPEEPVLL